MRLLMLVVLCCQAVTLADVDVAAARREGPAGLARLLREATLVNDELDAVAGQKDARFAELFWYTDLDAAKAEAQRAHRPILSLHLLGRLDEELSCINSRFFRTTLYPSADVSTLLRERFVLHWQTVMPAPRLTIELSDGTIVQTTVGGNSIHYVLTPDGQPYDAFPGLYPAEVFTSELKRAADDLARGVDRTTHRTQTIARLDAGIAPIVMTELRDLRRQRLQPRDRMGPDRPGDPRPLTVSKAIVQAGPRLALVPNVIVDGVVVPRAIETLAARYVWSPDANVISAMRSKLAAMSEDEQIDVIKRFGSSARLDTALNQHVLRPLILDNIGMPLLELNDWVYSTLFRTKDDPFAGAFDPAQFNALTRGGLALPTTTQR